MEKYVVRGVNIVSEFADYNVYIAFFIQGREKDLLQVLDNINQDKYARGMEDFKTYTKRLIEFLAVTSEIEIRKSRLSYSISNVSDGQFILVFVIAFDEIKKLVRDVYRNIYNKWEYDQPIERKAFIEFLEQFMEAVLTDDSLNDRDA